MQEKNIYQLLYFWRIIDFISSVIDFYELYRNYAVSMFHAFVI